MLQVVGQVLVEIRERAGVSRERVVRGAVGIARRLIDIERWLSITRYTHIYLSIYLLFDLSIYLLYLSAHLSIAAWLRKRARSTTKSAEIW